MKLFTPLVYMLLVFAFWNCNTKYYVRNADTSTPKLSGKTKIALVGFYPSHVTSSTTSGRRRTTTAGQNYSKPMKIYFQNGFDAETLATKSFREDLKEDDVKEFVRVYLDRTRKSGIDEIVKVVEIKEKPNKELSYKLRKIDADYFVVGYLLPTFETSTGLGILSNLITRLLALATLGTIPMYSQNEVNPEFYLYDKNLKLIKVFSYTNKYSTLTSWWGENDPTLKEESVTGNAGSTPLSKVFIPEVKTANIEITNFLNEQK